jgi:hypothetical protein
VIGSFFLFHWLYIHFGLGNEQSAYYAFWSGIGSDITEFAIVAGLVTMVRSRNCEVHQCWRLGRHATAAGHKVCRKHHPDDSLSAQDVIDAHERAS